MELIWRSISPHVSTGEFRLLKSMALCVKRPLMGLMGTVPDDHKILPAAVAMQRFKPYVIIERAGQRAVVLEPDIVVVQDIGSVIPITTLLNFWSRPARATS